MNMTWRLVGRVMLASGLLAVLLLLGKASLVSSLLPLFRADFTWITPEFKLLSLSLTSVGADQVVEVKVIWAHIQVIGNHVIYPDPRGIARASTLSAHALQGPGLALAIAAFWPIANVGSRFLELTIRLVAGCAAALCLAALDMPFTLAGELWSFIYDALDPGRRNALIVIRDFLQAGGRFALGAAVGLLCVQCGRNATARL